MRRVILSGLLGIGGFMLGTAGAVLYLTGVSPATCYPIVLWGWILLAWSIITSPSPERRFGSPRSYTLDQRDARAIEAFANLLRKYP